MWRLCKGMVAIVVPLPAIYTFVAAVDVGAYIVAMAAIANMLVNLKCKMVIKMRLCFDQGLNH